MSRMPVDRTSASESHINAPKVMILEGARGFHTGRYRAENKVELGDLLGIKTSLYSAFKDLHEASNTVEEHDIVIIHRAAHDTALENFILLAKRRGKIVAFDIDDLIFDERDLPYVKARMNWPPAKVAIFDEGFRRYRRTLELCDVAIVSTDYLGLRIQNDFGVTAFTLRYNLSQELIDISLREARNVVRPEKPFRIGYFAGSETQDANFLVAADALLKILDNNPSVELFIGGYLTLDNRFKRLSRRIRRSPFVDWRKLPSFMRQCHVILAPLEDNPHNRTKAETKYIESGILGIPLIASPLDSFKLCIRNEWNGFLAERTQDWIDKIELIMRDRHMLSKMGRNVQEHVLAHYTPEIRAKDYLRILMALAEIKRLRTRKFPIDYVAHLEAFREKQHGPQVLRSPGAESLGERLIRPQEAIPLFRLAWQVLTQEGPKALVHGAARRMKSGYRSWIHDEE